MARDLNASLLYRTQELQSGGMLELHEIQVQASPELYVYWTGHNATVSYFKPETAIAQNYKPVSLERGEIETDDGSKVPSMTIAIGGADQTIISYIENNDALRRFRVRQITVPADELGNASACLIDTFYIDGAIVDHDKEIAAFELTSKGAIAGVTVPLRVFRRDQCQYKYKNASTCQYAGGESTCRRTKDACASKDNLLNFGGFPGISSKKITLVF